MWRGVNPLQQTTYLEVKKMYGMYRNEYKVKVLDKVEKEFRYLNNFKNRAPKNKPLIFEDGCLNYAITEIKMCETEMGIEVSLDGKDSVYISGEQLVDGDIKLVKDRKYNIISYVRMR